MIRLIHQMSRVSANRTSATVFPVTTIIMTMTIIQYYAVPSGTVVFRESSPRTPKYAPLHLNTLQSSINSTNELRSDA